MKTLICLICIMIFGLFAPGCTIHFKGENLEMDVERQRVFRFDGVTFTDYAFYDHKTEKRGPTHTYRIQSIGFLDPQKSADWWNKRKFVTVSEKPCRSAR